MTYMISRSTHSTLHPPPTSTLFPYTTLFRSAAEGPHRRHRECPRRVPGAASRSRSRGVPPGGHARDRKSTRLNSSHRTISYAVFCLKKKKQGAELTMHAAYV